MATFLFLPVAVAILAILIWVFYLQETKRPDNFPPGPAWVPFLGNQRQLQKLSRELGGHHLTFSQLAKQYNTTVLGLKLGGELTLVVSGYRTVNSILTGEEYIGRPDGYFIRLRCMGKRRGITCVDGSFWVEQRRFVARHLREVGYGKKPMETLVSEEVSDILQILSENELEIRMEPIFAYSVLNVLWSFVTGSRVSRNDPRLARFRDLMFKRSKAFDMAGGMLNQMPWLRYVIPEYIGYNLLMNLNLELKDFFSESIEDHYSNWYPGREDDLIYSYISEKKRNEENAANFTDYQLILICLDLFFAGSTTTSHTLDFIFLCMVLYPEVQEKVAKEIEDTFKQDIPITYSDRLKMPYTEAVITEAMRMYGVTPITGPRRVLKDTTLEGYTIPKDTVVLINSYSVHHDPEYWGDPEVFRPERFLNEKGKLNSTTDHVLSFGLGRRRCLGELLARYCVFIFFTSVLRKYKVCPVSEKEMPSPVPLPGITISAKNYSVRLIPRY